MKCDYHLLWKTFLQMCLSNILLFLVLFRFLCRSCFPVVGQCSQFILADNIELLFLCLSSRGICIVAVSFISLSLSLSHRSSWLFVFVLMESARSLLGHCFELITRERILNSFELPRSILLFSSFFFFLFYTKKEKTSDNFHCLVGGWFACVGGLNRQDLLNHGNEGLSRVCRSNEKRTLKQKGIINYFEKIRKKWEKFKSVSMLWGLHISEGRILDCSRFVCRREMREKI